jgi:feruloyl esterase
VFVAKFARWVSAFALSSAVAVGIVVAEGTRDEAASADKCEKFAPDASIGANGAVAEWVAADDKASTPAHCRISATLSPVAGSKVGVIFRLPGEWNGNLLGLGGGGWAGNLRPETAAEGLKAGYATLQTDGGHPGTTVWDNGWAANPVEADDFAWRAVHAMTVAGKELVAAYYGKSPARAFFQGCSTGGRQGLMEAQRFPDDYDGIIAGAPVYTLQTQTSQLMRSNLFVAPGAGLDEAHVTLVNKAVLAACDANDDQADGVIADPRACHWDPGELACKPGQSEGSCLTEQQVSALSTAYSGVLAPDGSWAQWPLSRGGETVWKPFVALESPKAAGTDGGFGTLSPVLYGDRKVDFDALRPSDVVEARSSAFSKSYEVTDPNLGKYFAHGGKLLMYQGEYDAGPSPTGAIDYATSATTRTPDAAGKGLRLFLVPGMGHCRGGPGADKVDWLGALERWVSGAEAPGQLVATKEESPLSRPLCAWPRIARYKGSGDSNDPANYSCVARARS